MAAKALTLSHSSIQTYLDCPQKWKFKYVDKLPEKPRHFFSFGKSVHSALEFFYGGPGPHPPGLTEVLANYHAHWIAEGYKDAAQEAEYKAEGVEILTEYHRKHAAEFKRPFFTEYAFQLEVDGVGVRGFVDRVDKVGEDALAVVDYKTGKAFDLERVREDPQLTMYQMACERLLGLQVESLTLYHLPSQTAFTVGRHGSELVEALKGRIVDVARQIRREAFSPKPEERKCGWCDFKPLCPVFKHLYASQDPASAPAAPAEEELARLVDAFGKMKDSLKESEAEAEALKERIVRALRERGYVRAFGDRYEVSYHHEEKWEFADKAKVLDVIQRAGLWDKILAPSAPLVQKLMADPNLPLDVRDKLQRLGRKSEHGALRLKHVEGERG